MASSASPATDATSDVAGSLSPPPPPLHPHASANRRLLGRWRRLFRNEWMVSAALVGVDVLGWVAIYAVANSVRDAFFTSPLQFLVIGLLQLGTIVGALLIIGGYNRHTDMRSLPYATEHVLASV